MADLTDFNQKVPLYLKRVLEPTLTISLRKVLQSAIAPLQKVHHPESNWCCRRGLRQRWQPMAVSMLVDYRQIDRQLCLVEWWLPHHRIALRYLNCHQIDFCFESCFGPAEQTSSFEAGKGQSFEHRSKYLQRGFMMLYWPLNFIRTNSFLLI
jgi:hypothetical protein